MMGHINQLYPDVQAGPQPGDQAYLQSARAPGLLSAEGQQAAEAGPFAELYGRPDQSHRGAAVRPAWPRPCGQEAVSSLHHTQVHYGTFIANSKDTFSCGKKGRQCI